MTPNSAHSSSWLVAQRRSSGAGWNMHDGDHATLQDARVYVEAAGGPAPPAESTAS